MALPPVLYCTRMTLAPPFPRMARVATRVFRVETAPKPNDLQGERAGCRIPFEWILMIAPPVRAKLSTA